MAYESGDANRISAAVTEIVEKVGPMIAGGKTSINLAETVKKMNTLGGEIRANVGKMTGGNPVGKDYYERLYNMMDNAARESAKLASDTRQRAVNKHLGTGGAASTQQLKDAFIANLEGTFGTATYNGQKLFNNDPNAPAGASAAPAAAHAPAAGAKPQSITTPDGKVHTLQPDGSYN